MEFRPMDALTRFAIKDPASVGIVENAIPITSDSVGTNGSWMWTQDAAFVDFRQQFDLILPTPPRFVTYFPYRT